MDAPLTMEDLPNDILYMILAECVDDVPDPDQAISPAVLPSLFLVSRRWHEATLKVPVLWTTVTSRLSTVGISQWLERSREQPLRILLDFPHDPAYSRELRGVLTRVLRRVLVPCMPRVHALFVHGNLADIITNMRTDPVLRGQTAPHLIYLHVLDGSTWSSSFVDPVIPVPFPGSSIERLCISSWRTLDTFRQTETLENFQVRDLDVRMSDVDRDVLLLSHTVHERLGNFSRMGNLRTLRLDLNVRADFHALRLDISPPTPFVLTQLQQLHLSGPASFCRDTLDYIVCPSLRKLDISSREDEETPFRARFEKASGWHEFHTWCTNAQNIKSVFIWVDAMRRRIVMLGLPDLVGWGNPQHAALPSSINAMIDTATYTFEIHCPETHASGRPMFGSEVASPIPIVSMTVNALLRGLAPDIGTISTLEELCLLSSDTDQASEFNLVQALHGLDGVQNMAISCPPRSFMAYSKLWETSEQHSKTSQLQTLVLLGPATAAYKGWAWSPGLKKSFETVRERDGRAPNVVLVEDELTNNILRTMEHVDFQPALRGRN